MLADIPQKFASQMRIIDFIGILLDTGTCFDVQTRSGEMKTKRTLVVCDDSNYSVEMTVWSTVAQSFDAVDVADPVIAFKGCRITNFQGWTLTMDTDATYELNPDLPRAQDLRAWFKSVERSTIRPMNQGRTTEAVGSKLETSGRLICEMNDIF